MDEDPKPRIGKRIALTRDATLTTSDGHALSVTLSDISLDGIRIAHAGEDLVVGEIVEICDGRSVLRAQIKWVTNQHAGGEIVERPHPL